MSGMLAVAVASPFLWFGTRITCAIIVPIAQVKRPCVASLPNGLDTLVGDRGYRLSGGEKQRIAIARLLLKAPDVVVLDEATAHLDSESEVAVQRALKKVLAGRRGKTWPDSSGTRSPVRWGWTFTSACWKKTNSGSLRPSGQTPFRAARHPGAS